MTTQPCYCCHTEKHRESMQQEGLCLICYSWVKREMEELAKQIEVTGLKKAK